MQIFFLSILESILKLSLRLQSVNISTQEDAKEIILSIFYKSMNENNILSEDLVFFTMKNI